VVRPRYLAVWKKEVVTGFANQYGALNWIQREAANWVAEKIMTDPKIS
jgi:hypothetical protein